MTDNINNLSHYQGRYGIHRCFKELHDRRTVERFFMGNSLKYILRHQKKNGLEDLKKARKNLDWLIEELEKN